MGIYRKTGFIGAGKVGCSLGAYFRKHGALISGYHSQSSASMDSACAYTASEPFPTLADAVLGSDILFITTPDGVIGEVWQRIRDLHLSLEGKVFCHCSGAMSSEVFAEAEALGACRFSLHPLLAFPERLTLPGDMGDALFTAEGSEEKRDEITTLVEGCGNTIQWISPSDKVRYHAAAVFASNLGVALYDTAFAMLQSAGFSCENARKAFAPLIRGNTVSVLERGPAASLTGPVERNDISTVAKHLSVLSDSEKAIYTILSKRALQIAEEKHPDTDFSGLETLLNKE